MIKIKNTLLVLALTAISSKAFAAGSANANFQSTATLNSSCTVSAKDINFGVISQLVNSQAYGEVTSLCSKGVAYTIAVNYPNSIPSPRRITSSNPQNTDFLYYSIYLPGDSGHWGEGTAALSLIGNGEAQTNIMHGVISSRNKYVQPDNYSDTLTVTLAY